MNSFKFSVLAACLVALASPSLSAFVPVEPTRTPPREFDFGGQIWRIKSPRYRVAPGPNYWASSPDFVWQDEEGLHLTVAQKDGRWYSTELFTRRPTGYGTYTFSIDSEVSSFDPNIVAGFFTWDTNPAEANREIDIELASWGKSGGPYGHFVVQPADKAGRMEIFDLNLQGSYSTHRIIWTPQGISFSSYHGAVDPDDPEAQNNLIHAWSFAGTPPSAGNARFRINLWLFRGKAPEHGGAELTIRSFEFIPWEP